MNDFINSVSAIATNQISNNDIKSACDCLDRFTNQFNLKNTEGMDKELKFPHLLLSGTSYTVWDSPGKHPSNFFSELEKTGWSRTVYEAKQPILMSLNKIHFLVTYSRRNIKDEVISTHKNLWILTKSNNQWGIFVRSY